MSKSRIDNAKPKLLLKKQEISRAELAGVVGGEPDITEVTSGAISGIISATSSIETPTGVVTGASSAAASAYISGKLTDWIFGPLPPNSYDCSIRDPAPQVVNLERVQRVGGANGVGALTRLP